MTTRFVDVKTYQHPTGHRCMHCGRPATTTAVRKWKTRDGQSIRLDVHYCHEHADLIINGDAA